MLRRTVSFLLLASLALLCAGSGNAQLLHKKKRINKSTSADNTAAPDKVLYDRALNDIKHGHQEVGRLGMQTLINTYPDSEYLAKAKLSIADSYCKEGGTANLLQAVQGYKDFMVFFPFLPEAPYAQLQVANIHYQQMAKPDRDRSEAKAAEEEYQTFLTRYPKDPLAPKAEQRLRDVQEVIAEGDYRIGYFYYVRGDKRAAAARLVGVSKRYPLYSKSDKVLWMLGDIFEKSEHKEIASLYYSQIVKNYPLSGLVPDCKKKLVAYKFPVPQPDPQALAWMTALQNAPRQHESFVKKPMGLVRSGPHDEMMASAKVGTPNLQPEEDNTSATDILTGGGSRSQIVAGGAPGNTAVVATVTPGTSASGASSDAPDATQPAGSAQPAESGATNPPGAAGDVGTPAATPTLETTQPAAPAGSAANSPASTSATDPNATSGTTTPSPESSANPAQSGDETKADSSQAQDPSTQNSGDSKKQKESSSKKKKGLKKIVPW